MTEISERPEKASTTLATMLDYLGLNANVKAETRNEKIFLVTKSEDAGRIIGKKGQTLQSLELLVNRMSTRNDVECPWISIEVDGYSIMKNSRNRFNSKGPGKFNNKHEKSGRFNNDEAGMEKLKKQALDAAKEVNRWGEPVKLRPMNSHDRRIIHMTLKEDKEIQTESSSVENNDRLKTVTISVKEN
ncbi:MAG TPA: KH domain-containing protein [Victivallales bacterium]|nr:KH domain-containing protein [Victivallales bacterium]